MHFHLGGREVLMTLAACWGVTGSDPVVTLPLAAGMVIVSPQAGHSIWRAGAGLIHGQFLRAIRTVENDVHNQKG